MQLLVTDREGGRAPYGEMENFEEVDAKDPTPAKPCCKRGEPYKQDKQLWDHQQLLCKSGLSLLTRAHACAF